jgi:short-subunit dehydrogenase
MKVSNLVLLSGVGLLGSYIIDRLSQSAVAVPTIEGSVVIITGASSGIGRAYAVAFARRGARVVLAARRAELLEEVRQEIEPYAADVLVVPTDVTDADQLQALVNKTRGSFGRIDILVNNAGLPLGGPLHTNSPKAIRDTLNVNLTGAITLTSLCLPIMLAQRSGTIVNMASVAGGIGAPFYSVYGVTKHGLIAFSKTLRRELDGTGIGVVSVMPTWTATDMISPEAQNFMVDSSAQVDSPDFVAERTIEGLLRGEREIYFGGSKLRSGFWLERHLPALMDLYFRLTTTPENIALSRGE